MKDASYLVEVNYTKFFPIIINTQLTYVCLMCPRTSPVGMRTVISGAPQGHKTGKPQLTGCSSSIIQLFVALLMTFM